MTALGSSNSTALQYDAENHQTQATEPPSLGGATENYYYDGNGRRVEKSGPAGTSVFAYDASGRLAYEYDTAASTPTCTTCYLSPDHLGTPRMVTGASGNVIGWHDYLPFGEEIPNGIGGRTNFWGDANDNVNQKFTSKERDTETGLDYFGARYFSSPQGRFTSPDWSAEPEALSYATLDDPQTLNLYAYVRNNPLGRADSDGHEDAIAIGAGIGSVIEPGLGTTIGIIVGATVDVGLAIYLAARNDSAGGSPSSGGHFGMMGADGDLADAAKNKGNSSQQGRDKRAGFLRRSLGTQNPVRTRKRRASMHSALRRTPKRFLAQTAYPTGNCRTGDTPKSSLAEHSPTPNKSAKWQMQRIRQPVNL